ncbi:hypothetical protein [Adhaeribacter radiodurans]|nr:hypothetical protein [Adhaeribacter radiodurans]
MLDTDNGAVMGYSFWTVYKTRGYPDKIHAINLKDYAKNMD